MNTNAGTWELTEKWMVGVHGMLEKDDFKVSTNLGYILTNEHDYRFSIKNSWFFLHLVMIQMRQQLIEGITTENIENLCLKIRRTLKHEWNLRFAQSCTNIRRKIQDVSRTFAKNITNLHFYVSWTCIIVNPSILLQTKMKDFLWTFRTDTFCGKIMLKSGNKIHGNASAWCRFLSLFNF